MNPRNFICPVCLSPMKQVENDWANRWHCQSKDCYLYSQPVTFNMAKAFTAALLMQRSPWKRLMHWWRNRRHG